MIRLNALTCATVLWLLTACGGGSVADAPSSTVSGVAASGAPIAGRIFLKDSKGLERYVDTTDGIYSIAVNGMTPPFILKANWTVNNQRQTLYSIASQPGTANITPLTQVIVVAAAKSTSLDNTYASPTGSLSGIAAAVPLAVSDVRKTLNPLLTSFAQAGVDPITGAFTPNHIGMDALLDSVRNPSRPHAEPRPCNQRATCRRTYGINLRPATHKVTPNRMKFGNLLRAVEDEQFKQANPIEAAR